VEVHSDDHSPAADPATVEEARVHAQSCADRYRLRLAELTDLAMLAEAADLLCRVWGTGNPDRLVNMSMLRALAFSGNYVVGAYRDERMVGAAVAFLGIGHLHSHIAGVEPGLQGAGVGYTLKHHQRVWSLDRGIPEVRWTYDPLISRNAYFNLEKLGVDVAGYLPDFYGPLEDGINSGDATDRIYVRWLLAGARAIGAARKGSTTPDLAELRAGGAVVLLDKDNDSPVRGADLPAGGASGLLVAVPKDIEGLRAGAPALAGEWRHRLREALTGALSSGYVVVGLTRSGYYVLSPGVSA
jgi:predicted GNAT superfamily acetyltransferase